MVNEKWLGLVWGMRVKCGWMGFGVEMGVVDEGGDDDEFLVCGWDR